MIRNIISINKEKCVGCGLCVNACHQEALKIVNGKATLISESYCDGLGKCLPNCPTGALKVIEKEVEDFSNVKKEINIETPNKGKLGCGCSSSNAKEFKRNSTENSNHKKTNIQSELRQWPCQIKLVPINAPYFEEAKLLIAADCTAFAYANIHSDFIKNKITLIGCPKLDEGDYSEKLSQIIKNNNIKSIHVLRMNVPCCKGLENSVKNALINSGKMIPWSVHVISTEGEILEY